MWRSPNKTRKISYHHGDLRAALLAAGELELVERGAEAFSLRGVAKRAGVSHGAPAHHFGDVTGLLTAIASVGFVRFGQMIEARKSRDPGLPASTAVGLGYIEFALTHSALFSLMFSSSRPDFENEELDRNSDEVFQKFVADVQLDKPKSPGSNVDVELPVMAMWAKVHGLANLLLTGRMRSLLRLSKKDREQAIIQILKL